MVGDVHGDNDEDDDQECDAHGADDGGDEDQAETHISRTFPAVRPTTWCAATMNRCLRRRCRAHEKPLKSKSNQYSHPRVICNISIG